MVAVPDGGTTVIGGIYQVNEGVSSSRTPFLSRIPLLGWLFRNKRIDRTNDELLIFLTPHVIKAPVELVGLTASEQEKSKAAAAFTEKELNEFLDGLPKGEVASSAAAKPDKKKRR